MKKLSYKIPYLFTALLLFSCTRSEDVLPPATFPNTAEIFTDVPVGLTDQFFVSFDPNDGANPEAFGVDENESFEGTSSIRIDVPAPGNPDGNFVGGIFEDRGEGRDLTGYNALTFWAKGSITAIVGSFGYGDDFDQALYVASLSDVELTTDWQKYVVPFPDPSKLTQEKGMFLFSAGSYCPEGDGLCEQDPRNNTGGPGTEVVRSQGYTIWIDEIRFENLSTIAQPLRNALDLQVTYNVDGTDVTVNAAAAYFDVEEFDFAPTPPDRNIDDVVSVFSDVYNNVPVDNYNGFFQFATTQGGATSIAGESFIRYTQLNFVSINMFQSATDPDVDASEMTHMHVDINVREPIGPGGFLNLSLNNDNDGSNGAETSAAVRLNDYADLVEDQWVSYDIPMTDFAGVGTPDDIDLIFFISDGTVSEILVDNVYFYRN